MESRIKDLGIDTSGLDLADLESFGKELAHWQRGVNWWIGDIAKAAQAKYPETYHQAFPEWISPGLIDRCIAVAKAYPIEDRNPLATWSMHMKHAKDADRVAKVAEHVDAGRTTDEARQVGAKTGKNRWLIAIDCNYFLHRFYFSGAEVRAASEVAEWIGRTVERLRQDGLTDAVCCFDDKTNHRIELTKDWDDGYKSNREEKDDTLREQLRLVRELLEKKFTCVSLEGMEADDVMASYAKQFEGRVTLMTQDKDARQCLSSSCNILLDVEWEESDQSGKMVPKYKWASAKMHTEQGCTYNGTKVVGIPPSQWCEFQALAGDSVDGITGAKGIGPKIAADLIKRFGTAQEAIDAAKADHEEIKPAKRKALIEFEPRLETTMQLVEMQLALKIDLNTQLY